MSSAQEPLISRHGSPASEDHPDNEPDNDTSHGTADYEHVTAAQPRPSSPTLFLYLLTFSAGISGLLFGCKPPPWSSPPLNTHHHHNEF